MKLLSILIVNILVLSGLGAIAINIDQDDVVYLEIIIETLEIGILSQKFIDDKENYIKPILPALIIFPILYCHKVVEMECQAMRYRFGWIHWKIRQSYVL